MRLFSVVLHILSNLSGSLQAQPAKIAPPPSTTARNGADESAGAGSAIWLATDGSFKPLRMEAAAPVGRIVLTLK